jgi:hypothetical protein
VPSDSGVISIDNNMFVPNKHTSVLDSSSNSFQAKLFTLLTYLISGEEAFLRS